MSGPREEPTCDLFSNSSWDAKAYIDSFCNNDGFITTTTTPGATTTTASYNPNPDGMNLPYRFFSILVWKNYSVPFYFVAQNVCDCKTWISCDTRYEVSQISCADLGPNLYFNPCTQG